MLVVKLGGSLAGSDRLRNWLPLLAAADDLVVVPGGGPFADQVRDAQARWEFDDSAAHHMALLAMAQFGRMLCALQPGFRAAHSAAEIRRLLDQGATPVWMPQQMVLEDAAIAHSWEVTADSLAAWLCRVLCADRLLLVKSVPSHRLTGPVAQLRARGLVDHAFAGYVAAGELSFDLLSADAPDALAAFLRPASVFSGVEGGAPINRTVTPDP